MRLKPLVITGGLLVTACSLQPGAESPQTGPDSLPQRFQVQGGEVPSPSPKPSPSPSPKPSPTPPCCVAITGTSNVTVGGNAFNFEINTAANSPSGIGRVNFTDTRGTANPNDDVHAQWTIVETRCIIEGGELVGALAFADVDGAGGADIEFELRGEAPGGSDSHLQVQDLAADVLTGVSLAFGDFDTTGPNADLQRSTQNVFPDTDCNGIPNPGLSDFLD